MKQVLISLDEHAGSSWIVVGRSVMVQETQTQITQDREAELGINPEGVHVPEIGKIRARHFSYLCMIQEVIDGNLPEPEITIRDEKNCILAILSSEAQEDLRRQNIYVCLLQQVGTYLSIRKGYFAYDAKRKHFVFYIHSLVSAGITNAGKHKFKGDAENISRCPEVSGQAQKIRERLLRIQRIPSFPAFAEYLFQSHPEQKNVLEELLRVASEEKKEQEAYDSSRYLNLDTIDISEMLDDGNDAGNGGVEEEKQSHAYDTPGIKQQSDAEEEKQSDGVTQQEKLYGDIQQQLPDNDIAQQNLPHEEVLEPEKEKPAASPTDKMTENPADKMTYNFFFSPKVKKQYNYYEYDQPQKGAAKKSAQNKPPEKVSMAPGAERKRLHMSKGPRNLFSRISPSVIKPFEHITVTDQAEDGKEKSEEKSKPNDTDQQKSLQPKVRFVAHSRCADKRLPPDDTLTRLPDRTDHSSAPQHPSSPIKKLKRKSNTGTNNSILYLEKSSAPATDVTSRSGPVLISPIKSGIGEPGEHIPVPSPPEKIKGVKEKLKEEAKDKSTAPTKSLHADTSSKSTEFSPVKEISDAEADDMIQESLRRNSLKPFKISEYQKMIERFQEKEE